MGEVKNLVVVMNPIGIKECQKCGSCCKNMIIRGNFSKDTLEWFVKRGCGILKDKSIAIPFRCPHLTKDNMCDDYENRPKVCREYKCWK